MLDNMSEIIKPDRKETVELEAFPNECTTQEMMIKNLDGIDSMTDKEAYQFLEDNIKEFLYGDQYIKYFLKSRVLIALLQVCYDTEFTDEMLVRLNMLLYRILMTDKLDTYRVHLVFMIAETTNKYQVYQLLGRGVPGIYAVYASICNNASHNQVLNIRRLNYCLTIFNDPDPKLFTVQRFVDIYSALYHDSLSNLLTANTFSVEIKRALEKDRYWVSKEMIEIDDNIAWATLFILESVPAADITRCLLDIGSQFDHTYDLDTHCAKFSYHNLPANQFRKIPTIVEQLESLEGIVLP